MLAVLLAAKLAVAQAMPVPVDVQVVLLKKIVKYDKVLKDKKFSDIKVLVAYDSAQRETANAVTRAFERAGMPAQSVTLDRLSGAAAGAAMVYIVPGTATGQVRQVTVAKKLLSVAGLPKLCEDGKVSVALGIKGSGRPEIVVNLPRLEAEGHALSSYLLNLARVIR